MKKIDCFGDICPVPLIKIIEEYKKMSAGESVMLVTDHSCSEENINDYFKNIKATVEASEVMNGVWEIVVTKL